MKNIDKNLFILFVCWLGISNPVYAGGESEFIGIDTGPGRLSPDLGLKLKADDEVDIIGLNYGPGRIVPDLKLKMGYDDNLTLESTNEISTFFTTVQPHVAYVVSDATRRFVVDYLLDTGFYEGSSEDDYINNRLRASIDYNPTRRIYTALRAEFLDSEDPRGTGRAEGGNGVTQLSADEWHQWGVEANAAYGAPNAKGRVEGSLGITSKEYDTNRFFTSVRDQDVTFGAARFFYRIRPKTHLLFETRISDVEYDVLPPSGITLDSTTYRYLTGVTWAATYKTTGFFKIGYIDKDFDSNLREDNSGLTWELGADWKPRTYSVVHFETAQTINETDGTGDAVDSTFVGLSWDHVWKSRFKTVVALLYTNNSFDPSPREDDLFDFKLRAEYDFRRWLQLGAGYQYRTLDSSDSRFDYDNNVIDITAFFTL